MKNTNKKTIVKFAAFVIIFALICIAVNFAAGQIMNKEFLSICKKHFHNCDRLGAGRILYLLRKKES